MKLISILILFFLPVIASGQSAKKWNKLLLAECASEKQKQDSALSLFLTTKHQFDSLKLAFKDKTRFLKKGEIRLMDLFLTTSGLSSQLRSLDVEPVPAIIPDFKDRKFTGYSEFVKPIEKSAKVEVVFERVPGEVELKGLSRKEQNAQLDKKAKEYRRYALSNSMNQEQMENSRDKLRAFLPRMDSLIGAYDLLSEELTRDNSSMQKKMDELEANFKKKGPEGFSYAYHRAFPEYFPDFFPPLEASKFGDNVVGAPDNTEGGWEASYPVAIEAKEPEIYEFTEEPATFPGGAEKMKRYMAESLRYSESMKAYKASGRAYVRFVISETGQISDVRVMRGVPNCSECDSEAIRLIEQMPNWIAAIQNGKKVKSYQTVVVKFESE